MGEGVEKRFSNMPTTGGRMLSSYFLTLIKKAKIREGSYFLTLVGENVLNVHQQKFGILL